MDDENLLLQLFHLSDQEANSRSVDIAPQASAVLNTLAGEDLDGDGQAGYPDTLILSSGDVWIPGLFYDASASIFGIEGAADIIIQNELGIQAVAFGNHEFDNGTEIIGQLLDGVALDGFAPHDGANFPYLSGNLDFENDAFLGPLVTADGQDAADIPGRIAASTVIETSTGVRVGVVGATTPTLGTISSPGDAIGIRPSDPNDIPALAAEIQKDVDALLAANPDLDKVIVLAHMQAIDIENELASLLEDVDIIMAGGSNTRLFDDNDQGFGGEAGQGVYPTFVTNPDGKPVAVINTDFQYKYIGRLVIEFDENGDIVPASYDPLVSGAYATDAAGLARIGAEGNEDPEIVAIAEQVRQVIVEGESEFFAVTETFLNGERQGGGTDGVRTQETNLGNLTADANLNYAKAFDDSVVVSIKNGGGIRSSIGQIFVPGGGGEQVRLPPEGVEGAKPDGGISKNDVANALAFNNGLSLFNLTTAQLAQTLEHIVSEYTSIEVDSGLGQVGGVKVSFDPSRPPGDRIQSAGVFDGDGRLIAKIVENGEVVDNGDQTFRTVTLNFLADGGSGYPFPEFEATADRVDLLSEDMSTGDVTFAPDGSEQDALAEFLLAEFGNEAGDPTYNDVDTPVELDERIQNLDFRSDTVFGETGDTIRIATYNASLNRNAEGELISALSTGDDSQIRDVAQVIQTERPEILLINEFDFDADGQAATLFQQNYLSVGQGGAEPIAYEHVFVVPSNTGVDSGFDLDNDGQFGGPGDAQGFGFFEGQFGFVILSQHDILEDGIRSFQDFLWKDVPGALLFDGDPDGRPLFDPSRPFDAANPDDPNTSFYTAEEVDILRLSSKNHVDVPISVDGEIVHLLASHPTPPVFDGIEDRNGKRNFDEIRLWKDYIEGADYLVDDDGLTGGLAAGERFVIVGDQNSDPFDGDSVPGAVQQIVENDLVIGSVDDATITPTGLGSLDQQGGVNADHQGDRRFDTADFGFNPADPANDVEPGNLRVDYALPSQSGFDYVAGRVVWPAADDPFSQVTDFPTSDHRMVSVDLAITEKDGSSGGPLEFLGTVSFPTGATFENSEIGGLSSITYDASTGVYHTISDAQTDYRYYTVAIDLADGLLDDGDITFEGVTRFFKSNGNPIGDGQFDLEGFVLNPHGNFFVTTEGFANGNRFVDPEVLEFSFDGQRIDHLNLDARYSADPDGEAGIRNNLALESATITPDGRTFYTAMENALIEDGPAASPSSESPSRIIQYDLDSRDAVAEFVYLNDPVPNETVPPGEFAVNGLVELVALEEEGLLLALERDFSVGVDQTGTGHGGSLYEISTRNADNVIDVASLLDGDVAPVEKTELLDFSSLGIEIDNLEGLTFGPDLADGRKSLIVVADNNFSDSQATQFLAFALDLGADKDVAV